MFSSTTVPAQPPVVQPACDGDCLNSFVDRYIEAMIAKDVSDDLFAREIKFTENGIRLPFGTEGAWHLSTGRGKYRFYVPDVETQQVAYLGTIIERGRSPDDPLPAGFSLRLKIEGGLITEVEQLVSRPEISLLGDGDSSSPFPETGVAVDALGEPHPVFREVIPENVRPSRDALIETANYYFTGLQGNDGKGYYPFTGDCDRRENGIAVLDNVMDPETGQRGHMTCKRQFEVALKGVVTRVRDRRFVAVDREHGIVFAFAFFDHENINWTWQLGELFKIENGLIRRIEAIFHRAPYGIPSGWSTYEQSISDGIQTVR
jgi:hypothetical protein